MLPCHARQLWQYGEDGLLQQKNCNRRSSAVEDDDSSWNARHFLYQLRSDKTGTRGAAYEARDEAYGGADCEFAAAC